MDTEGTKGRLNSYGRGKKKRLVSLAIIIFGSKIRTYLHAVLPAVMDAELEYVEDAPGRVADEEHGRDATEDGEQAPLGAVRQLEAKGKSTYLSRSPGKKKTVSIPPS